MIFHHLTTQHWRTNSCECWRQTYEAVERSVVDATGFFTVTETFGANRDDVSVWEITGFLFVDFRRRIEHCVVIRASVARFLL